MLNNSQNSDEQKINLSDEAAGSSCALPPFGLRDKVGYALGDFGCNLSFSLFSTFLYLFYTQYIGLTTATWAIVIIILKIWDAVNDPLMGGIIDGRKVGKGGKFKPMIRLGSYGLIFAGALAFLPIPNAPYWLKVAVCVSTYLVWDISYTITNVPYGALNAAISADPNDRASLSTFRSIGAAFGGLIAMLLPMVLFDGEILLGGRLIWVALIMGVGAFFAFRACVNMVTERVQPAVVKQKFDYIQTIKGFLKNRPLIGLSLASFALIVFFMSTSTTNALLFQNYFGDAQYMLTLANIVMYLPFVLTIPFVGKLVRRFGKKLAAGVPLAISVAGCVLLLVIPIDPSKSSAPWIYIGGMMLVQLGGGVFQLVCWAMVSDCIDYQELKTGRRDEGSVYAIYSLFRKLAQGVAASLVPLSMTWVGYNEALVPNQLPGVAERMKNMSVLLILIGSAVMLVSLLLVYNLGKDEVNKMSEQMGKLHGGECGVDISEALQNRD